MQQTQPLWDALCPEWKVVPVPEPATKLVVRPRAKSVFNVGEPIAFEFSLLTNGIPQAGARLDYQIDNEGGDSLSGSVVTDSHPAVVETVSNRPGFVLVTVKHGDLTAATGAAVEPTRIEGEPEIDGFDAFWTAQRNLLAQTPMKVLYEQPLEVVLPELRSRVECFDVRIACAGNAPVSAILAKPKHATKGGHPAYIFVHGAGVRSAFQPLTWADAGMLALNVNAHGLENGHPDEFYKALAEGRLKDCESRSVDSPEQSVFRDMALRVLRAMEYLKSLPEWDGKHLVIHGGSQGGWQSLVAGALDPQVTLCVAGAPAMCNQLGARAGRAPSWPGIIKREGTDPRMLSIAPLFDGVAFSRRIRCEVLFSVAYSDTAAVPSSIYAAFNACGGKATMVDFPDCGHAGEVFWLGEDVIKASCKC